MSLLQTLAAFVALCVVMALTPGLDTLLVVRTAVVESRGRAFAASLGITLGCLTWGAAASLGVLAALQASGWAFMALQAAGALYLIGAGVAAWFRRRADPVEVAVVQGGTLAGLRRGYLTNLANPKAGVFYLSLLPQFLHPAIPAPLLIAGLVLIHAGISLAWLIAVTVMAHRVGDRLRSPGVAHGLDRVCGLVFVVFGALLLLALTPWI